MAQSRREEICAVSETQKDAYVKRQIQKEITTK